MARTGRPKKKNPKIHMVRVRLDNRDMDVLTRYRETYGVAITEAVRRGIRKLEPDIK